MLVPAALEILAERLRTIDGLTVTTDPGATVVVPMAVIADGEIEYNESMRRGAALMAFTVTVYVSRADQPEGLYEARTYLSGHGDASVRAAVETEVTGGDDLLNKVVIDTGQTGIAKSPAGESFIAATFAGRAHVPGEIPS